MVVPKKFILAITVFFILLISLNTQNGATASFNSIVSDVHHNDISLLIKAAPVTSRDSIMDSILAIGKKFIGRPYRSRVYNSWPLDCSGFAAYLYSLFGYDLPRSSPAQALLGKKVPMDSLTLGDLMFFKGRSSKSKSVGHTAIFYKASHDTIYFLHSASTGIRIDKYNGYTYYTSRYLYSKRMDLDQLKRIPVNHDGIAKLDSVLKAKQPATKSKSTTVDKSTHANNTSPEGNSHIHFVKKGDTLSEISRRYGISVDKLCALNGIKKTSTLQIGRKIKIK